MNNIKFRRQYLLTPTICENLIGWKHKPAGDHHLYVHPECDVNVYDQQNYCVVLIGYFIHPKNPQKSTMEILGTINSDEANHIAKIIYGLVGRFVLMVYNKTENFFTVFNDCCGLKTAYYTKASEGICIASQPLLLKLVSNVQQSKIFHEYRSSEYYKNHREHYVPTGITFYDEVFQLLPNHYLTTHDLQQHRYWPVVKKKKLLLDEAVEDFANILKNSMVLASKRFNLAVAVTAGWDSRILLSASKQIANDVFFFTFKYRMVSEKSADIKTPSLLLQKLGLSHNIIDTNTPINQSFAEYYQSNTHINHFDDWGKIAQGIFLNFPKDRISVRGGCAEIVRYAFSENKYAGVLTYHDLLNIEPYWKELSFIVPYVAKWVENVNNDSFASSYSLRDLFYWEHRMGSWLAQNKLEWDIAHEVFVPFNNRELLDIALSVDPKYRQGPDFVFFRNVILKLWPEVLDIPINPISKADSFKRRVFEKAKLVLGVNTFNSVKKYLKKQ